MKYKLVKLNKLSGNKASVYTVHLEEEGKTLLDLFIKENEVSFKSELKDMLSRLNVIGNITGAKEDFFKLYEGNIGDGVCALYDRPDSNLRLYCIRYGSLILIVGGGGVKPKTMRKLQEDDKLTQENYFLRDLSRVIKEKMEDNEIRFSLDFMDFEGDLNFNDKQDE